MIDYKATLAIAKQIKAYRATPGNAPQILELLNRLAGEFDNDAKTTEFLAREGLKDMADTFFRFRESIKWKEYTQQRPPARRSSEVVEPPKPRPHVRPQGAYLADFGHHAAREEAGGRFAAVNTFVAEGEVVRYPDQPPNSPWHHNPVGDEPTINFEATTRVLGNEQPAAPVTAPVERALREDDWLGDIDRLLEVIEEQRAENKEQRAEINRLKAALETQSGAAAPVASAVADAAPTGGEQVEVPDPLSADFSSTQQKE
jgi:hypothetical protein